MKPVQIDFVAPRAWKFIWAMAAVVALAIVATTGSRLWQLRQQRMELAQQLTDLQAQQSLQIAQAKAASIAPDKPRAASEVAATRLLQRDWNRLYDAIETPALARVRLTQLGMDAVTGQVVLEFELESVAQAGDVTRALNEASGQDGVWQLQRLDSAGQGAAVGSVRVKGAWRAALE